MTMDGKTKSCLSALVVLLGAAIQADGFVVGPVAPVRTAGSSSSLTKGTSSRWATSSSKLQSSPYEEYMKTRQQKESGMAVSPEAEEKASMFDSYQASRNEQAAMPPAEKEKSLFESYMASSTRQEAGSVPFVQRSRGGGAAPAPAPAAPSAPTPAASSSPSTELSPYEEYMQSRNKIKAAEAATTFEEKTKASAYEEYMAARRAKESGSDVPVADCVEEECSAEEVEQEAGLFASYMASRGIKVEATTEEQVSYYDSHMASRKHVKDANADVTPQEAENVSLFDSYMASRNAADAARKTMPPAEAQKALFDDFQKESSPTPTTTSSKTPPGHKGTGGMADTRDPAPVKHEDPRKSIPAAPSFAEYLKSKRN